VLQVGLLVSVCGPVREQPAAEGLRSVGAAHGSTF
jgi:hypothetical protein